MPDNPFEKSLQTSRLQQPHARRRRPHRALPDLKAHVNTAESVHAMFKRAIIGVWHQISGKHMHRYLGEIEFRWNRRGPFESRLATLFGTKSGPLPLKALFA
jgi:hypothetical protein